MEIGTDNKHGASGAGPDKLVPQQRRRRMAREPKDTGEATAEQAAKPAASDAKANPAAKERGPSKIGAVIVLLEREQGATLAEMVEATGWQPHTTRAALTGLRKKGHAIERDQREGVTCYRIANTGA